MMGSADVFINFIAAIGMVSLWLSIRYANKASVFERRIGNLALTASFLLSLRAAFWMTGSHALERIALIPAIVIPVLILIAMEGLLRRHAPFVMKLITSLAIVIGGVVLVIGHRQFEPWFSYGLAGVQVSVIGFSLLWVWLRDKSKNTEAENQSATILAVTLVCLALACVTDFPEIIALPVKLGAVGMLMVAYILVFVASQRFSIKRTIFEIGSIVTMVGVFLSMSTSVLGADSWQAIAQLGAVLFSLMLTTVIVVRVFTIRRGVNGASEGRLAQADTTDLYSFLEDAMSGPLTPHAFILKGNDLTDYDMVQLEKTFQTLPVISNETLGAEIVESLREQISDILSQNNAEHVFMAASNPPVLVVCAAQSFGDARELASYLSLVSKMSKLIKRDTEI